MPKKPLPLATQRRLFLAGEQLFAAKGFHGTTLREITALAGVNLAAVNYHHGDKAGLYLEILRSRLREMNHGRAMQLQAAEQQAGQQRIPLPTLLDALAGPAFGLGGEEGTAARQLVGRLLIDELPLAVSLLAEEFEPMMARFAQALRRHAMGISPEEFYWRLNFVVGSLHHTLGTLHQMQERTRGICRNHDNAAAQQRFVVFATRVFDSNGL